MKDGLTKFNIAENNCQAQHNFWSGSYRKWKEENGLTNEEPKNHKEKETTGGQRRKLKEIIFLVLYYILNYIWYLCSPRRSVHSK